MKPKFQKKRTKGSSLKVYDDEIKSLKDRYETIPEDITTFKDLPLSEKTLKGLKDSNFVYPTEIQKKSIGPALKGKDILAAAITGSGKTLAFLIPILEHLYLNKWSRGDGVCAIIISPTRELAYQIFETLKKVGRYHDFSAGLIIGGKNLKFERSRVDQCNIFVCTPGRLLQHMDENPIFNVTSMELLVLDEADRCLDMGFEKDLNSIIENFPPERQTLLFSATQTNSVSDLIRLNLKDPVYIGIQKEKVSLLVPDLLQQNYVVVNLEDKITVLWSFIKNHLKQKIIVFLSTCKQVKYVYEICCKLRPGVSLLAIYGTLHQDKRIAIYENFLRKNHVVLFATDVASRGLDFPSVNWVIQLDCPEDVTQYIHRAGRSARNKMQGESLLVLTPAEENRMIEELQNQQIKIQKIIIDPKKLFSPRAKIEAFLAQNSELKASAQRAYSAYIKSVLLMKNKQVFKVTDIDFDNFANSLGLVVTPRINFLERFLNKNSKLETGTGYENRSKAFQGNQESDSESDEDFLKLKRANHEIIHDEDESSESLEIKKVAKKDKRVTKAAKVKKVLKKKLQINAKRIFNDEGEEVADPRRELQSKLSKEFDQLNEGGINVEFSKKLLSEEDKYDKERFKNLVKERHKKKKEKLKKQNADVGDSEQKDSFSSEEESVDLSWLPDPRKVYEKTEDKREVINSTTDTESDSDIEDTPVAKRSKITSKLSLNDAEIIAANILASSY